MAALGSDVEILIIFLILMMTVFVPVSIAQIASGELYDLSPTVESRSISFENPTGEKGGGGKAASHLGVGRKGFPAKTIDPGEIVTLCEIRGSGTIRHIWMTGSWTNLGRQSDTTRHELLRSTIIRAYWDNQSTPSIECPLGDFMGFSHGKVQAYQSFVHSVGENGAFNIWLAMPFVESARITLTNESEKSFNLYYQIDYTINDKHPEDIGRLHVCFRRENPTQLKRDFEVLPKRSGNGRYIGTVLGVRSLEKNWWGEGEIKIYLDGDTDFPTICGTGSEDYVGLSYGIQQTSHLYHGCSYNYWDQTKNNGFVSMYRWHLVDPVYWQRDCRITIQQIGWSPEAPGNLYERQDDWSAATFWYEPIPSAPLLALPRLKERVAALAPPL